MKSKSKPSPIRYVTSTFALLAVTTLTAQAADAPTTDWERSAAVGLTLTRGNSETMTATANVLGQRKWDVHELRLGADATYGETQDQDTDETEKTAETLHGFAQYNRLFGERWYGYARIDALHDDIADVDYRVTVSPGVGYYFIKDTRTQLSAEAGPGIVFEKQGGEESTYLTLRLAERFEHRFNDRVRLWQSLEWLPQVDNLDNWILNAELGVESQLTEKLSLRVFAQDTYDNEPAEGREENDLKLVTALAYTF